MSKISIEEIRVLSQETKIEYAASAWRKEMGLLRDHEEREKKAREQLIEACGHENYEGNGVRVQNIERKGSVDYAAIPELKGVDLEAYRKKGTSYWSVNPSVRD